jgi:hypothetical protein
MTCSNFMIGGIIESKSFYRNKKSPVLLPGLFKNPVNANHP